MASFKGYGLQTCRFSGHPEEFELWSVKFKGMLRLQKLIKVLEDPSDQVDASENADVFAHLAQCLDDHSLS